MAQRYLAKSLMLKGVRHREGGESGTGQPVPQARSSGVPETVRHAKRM